MAAEASALPELTNYVVTAAVGIGTAVAAAMAYFKKPKDKGNSEGEVAVLSAALFSDKTLIQELVNNLANNTRVVEKHIECSEEIIELMKRDYQQRHDEQIIRAALAKHGIQHTG